MSEIHKLAERILALNKDASYLLEGLNLCRVALCGTAEGSGNTDGGEGGVSNGDSSLSNASQGSRSTVTLGPPIHEQVGNFYFSTRRKPQIFANPIFAHIVKLLWRKFPEISAITAKTQGHQQLSRNAAGLQAEIDPYCCVIAAAVEFIERGLVLLLQTGRLIGLAFELVPDLVEAIFDLLINWTFVHKLLFAVPLNELKVLLACSALLHEILNNGEKHEKYPSYVRFFKDYEKFPWSFAVEQLEPVANVVLSLLPKVKADVNARLFVTGDQLKLSKLFHLSVDINGPTNVQNLFESIQQYLHTPKLPAIALVAFSCFPNELIQHGSLFEMVCDVCQYGWLIHVTGDVSLPVWDLLATALRTLPKNVNQSEVKRALKESLTRGTERAPQLHREQRDVILRYLKQAQAIVADRGSMEDRFLIVASLLRRGSMELEWYLSHLASPLDLNFVSSSGVTNSLVSKFASNSANAGQSAQQGSSAAGSSSFNSVGTQNAGHPVQSAELTLGIVLGQPGSAGSAALFGNASGGVHAIMGANSASGNHFSNVAYAGELHSGGTSGSSGTALNLVSTATSSVNGSSSQLSAASESMFRKAAGGARIISYDNNVYSFIVALQNVCEALKSKRPVLLSAIATFIDKHGAAQSRLLRDVVEANGSMEPVTSALMLKLADGLASMSNTLKQEAQEFAYREPLLTVDWMRYQLCLVLPTISMTNHAVFASGFVKSISTLLYFYRTFLLPYECAGELSWCPAFYNTVHWHLPAYYGQFVNVLANCSIPEVLQSSVQATIHLVKNSALYALWGNPTLTRSWFIETGSPSSEEPAVYTDDSGRLQVKGELLYRHLFTEAFAEFLFQSLSKLAAQVVHLHGLVSLLLSQHNNSYGFSSSSANAGMAGVSYCSGGSSSVSGAGSSAYGSNAGGHLSPTLAAGVSLNNKVQLQRARQGNNWYLIAKYLVFGFACCTKVEAGRSLFYPNLYFRTALLSRIFEQINSFAFCSEEVLAQLASDDNSPPEDCVLLEVKRPLLFVQDVLLYLKAVSALASNTNVDMVGLVEQVFHDLLDPAVIAKYTSRLENSLFEYKSPAAQKSRMKERKKQLGSLRKNPYVITYALWLVDFFCSKVGSAEAIFSFSEQKFVAKQSVSRYVDAFELLSLCEITGPNGYAFFDMKLTQLMCTLIALLKEFITQHFSTFTSVATGWQSEQILDAIKRLKGWREAAQQVALLGCIVHFRSKFYERMASAVQGAAPYVLQFVKNVHERYPPNLNLSTEFKDLDFLANSVGILDRIDTSMQEAVTACLWEQDPELMDTVVAVLPAVFASLTLLAASDDNSSYLVQHDALSNNFHAIAAAFLLISANVRHSSSLVNLHNATEGAKLTETMLHKQYLSISTALLCHLSARGDPKNEFLNPVAPWVILRQFMDQTNSIPGELESIIPYSLISSHIHRFSATK